MKIGIDISQIAYEGTGVARLLENLVAAMLKNDKKNEYVLFFSSLRRNIKYAFVNELTSPRVKIRKFKLPPSLLDLLWNKLHMFPIEWFVGDVDVFITSDWTEPPSLKAKKGTILYDLIVYKYPEETHNQTKFFFKDFILKPNIVASQKRRLHWVKKESEFILCISESTKKDAIELLGIPEYKLKVIRPGV